MKTTIISTYVDEIPSDVVSLDWGCDSPMPELPSGLIELFCDELTVLPDNLPNSIQVLSCAKVEVLKTLPTSLKSLHYVNGTIEDYHEMQDLKQTIALSVREENTPTERIVGNRTLIGPDYPWKLIYSMSINNTTKRQQLLAMEVGTGVLLRFVDFKGSSITTTNNSKLIKNKEYPGTWQVVNRGT